MTTPETNDVAETAWRVLVLTKTEDSNCPDGLIRFSVPAPPGPNGRRVGLGASKRFPMAPEVLWRFATANSIKMPTVAYFADDFAKDVEDALKVMVDAADERAAAAATFAAAHKWLEEHEADAELGGGYAADVDRVVILYTDTAEDVDFSDDHLLVWSIQMHNRKVNDGKRQKV